VRRGDVYRAALNPVVGSEQSGTRPVVIVSRDAINATGTVLIIVPITARANKKHIYKSHVELKMGEAGLSCDSVALCEQVRAISQNRLQDQLGSLTAARMSQLSAALKIALDLP
jgi:mRNA interferase MazF